MYPVNHFTVENTGVASAEYIDNRLAVTGKIPGSTYLMIWTPSGLEIFNVIVGVGSGRFVLNSRMPRSISAETSVITNINEAGKIQEPSILHNIYAQYQFHETTRFEADAFIRRLSHDKYRFDIRTIGLDFLKSGWEARLGDTQLVGAEQGGLNLRGANVTYTINNEKGRQYKIGVSGGMVNEQSYDYLDISDFFSGNSAFGGRLEIDQEDFNIDLGLNAYYDKDEHDWTALASIDELWWPVKQVRIGAKGISFKGKNRANLNTYIDTDLINLQASYNFIQEGFTGFGVGQELPQEHNYNLYITEKIIPEFGLYQQAYQAFSLYDTASYYQKGRSLTMGGGFLFFIGNVRGRLGFKHYQANSSSTTSGQQLGTSRTLKEQWETVWHWFPKQQHTFRFEFYEAFEKTEGANPTGWDVVNNLFLFYKWKPTDRFTLQYEIRARFFPDFLKFNQASTQFSVIMYNKQWRVGSTLLFASYNGGDYHESREELFAYRPLGNFFDIGFRTLFYQYFRQNQSVQSAQTIFFNLGVRVPLGRIKPLEAERYHDYLNEKEIEHKIIAVFDKNQSLSLEKGEKKLAGIEFMIEGKKYKTGSDGSLTFKSANKTVTIELLSGSIPKGMELLNPAIITPINMIDKETIYYFAEQSSSLIIKAYAKDWDSAELPIHGIMFMLYDLKSNKLISKVSLEGGWGVAYVPVNIKEVAVKVDLDSIAKKYKFDADEKDIFLTDQQTNEITFIAETLYKVVGKISFKGWNKEEIDKLRKNIYITLGEHKIQIGADNFYYLEGVKVGEYELKLNGIPSNILSSESDISRTVEIGGLSTDVGLPELQVIKR
ncbi:MAG: hypothetical protein ABH859_03895 [Pseudomonadota bacterium]